MQRWKRTVTAVSCLLVCAAAAADEVEVIQAGPPSGSKAYVVLRSGRAASQPAAVLLRGAVQQGFDSDPVLRSLLLRKGELETNLGTAREKLGPQHRSVEDLQGLIAQIERQIQSRRVDLMQQYRLSLEQLANAGEHRPDAFRGATGGVWRIFPSPRAGKKVKAAYLGVTVSPVDGAVRKQIELPPGVGLVVEHVDPDSPAKAAGVEIHDVLHKLNDQILINHPQLAVLVRTFKPGERVTLTVIRKAKPVTLEAKLVEKELPEVPPPPPWRTPGWMETLVYPELVAPEAFRLNRMFRGVGPCWSYFDGEHELELSTRDGKKHLTVRDKFGRITFEGAVDTAEQRRGLPPEILRKLEKMGGFKPVPETPSRPPAEAPATAPAAPAAGI